MSNGNNIGLTTLAQRYSEALINLGESSGQLDKFDADLDLLKSVVDSSKELKMFIEHPTLRLEDKKEVIESIFDKDVSQYILNFVKLLLDRNRIFALPAIVSNYHQALNKKRNITVAQIVTSIRVENELIDRVKAVLESKFRQTNRTRVKNKSLKL